MNTSTLKSHFCFPKLSKLTSTKTANPSLLIPTRTTLSHLKHPTILSKSSYSPSKTKPLTKTSHIDNNPINLELKSISENQRNEGFHVVLPDGYSRIVVVGAVSIGFVLLLMGIDNQKALALGPEGPLMEEFWDNVRRYGLYALTVSSGALYTIFQPIFELLKNPISAILILTILGGGFFIVTQIVSAMIGVTEFSYEYAY